MTRPPALVLHPFVLACYPVLLLYSRNADSVYPGETLAALVVVPLATLTGYAIVRRIWGDPARAGLATAAVLFVLFSFERNVHAAQVRGWGGSAGAREWLVLGGEVGLLGVALASCRGRWFPARALNTVANAGSLALVAFLVPALIAANRPLARPAPIVAADAPPRATATAIATTPAGRDPDIYFLVLDAYGRSDVLKALLGFDNGAFLARMERRGFFVGRESTSNYCQTALSITATLRGEYHDDLAGSPSRSRLPLRDRIGSNSFLGLLRGRSYRLVGFASGFGLTDGFVADDHPAPPLNLAEFDALLCDMTPIPTILGQGAGRASHRRHRERILYLFDHLPAVAADPRPTFCLAHVLAPHPPFVFGRDGADVSQESSAYRLTDGVLWSDLDGHGGPDDYAAHYRDQAAYITGRVEEVVDRILAGSAVPPVIIIQGDHGPGSHFDPDAARPNDLRERMSILNLALIPGGGAARLYPAITPVNTFRVVADHCFGTDRGLLPDRNYYSSYQSPYVLTEVTSDLAGTPSAAGRVGQ